MDRYGRIYTTYNMILDAIRKVPTATVLLNGDSPLFYKPTIPNPVEYFGLTWKSPTGSSTIPENPLPLTVKASSNEAQYLCQLGLPISVKIVVANDHNGLPSDRLG